MKRKLTFGMLLVCILLPLNVRIGENGTVIEETSAFAASNTTEMGKVELFNAEEIKEIKDYQNKYWNIRNNDVVEKKFEILPVVKPEEYAPGQLKSSALDNVEDYINLIREEAGLASVTWDEHDNRMAQYGTIGILASGRCEHNLFQYPRPEGMDPSFWVAAHTGTMRSNLHAESPLGSDYESINVKLNDSVDVFMIDAGIRHAGHRIRFFEPSAKTVGIGHAFVENLSYGSVSFATAMNTRGGATPAIPDDYIVSWPTEGVFPYEYMNWGNTPWSASFFEKGYNLEKSKVKVTLTNNSTNQQWFFSEAQSDGYFTIERFSEYDNVVFYPDKLNSKDGDLFTVKIEGISGAKTSYQYSTKIYHLNKEYDVNAVIPVVSVDVHPKTIALIPDQTSQLDARVSPSHATNKNVTWSSSNSSVAVVDATGKVTAKAVGDTVITVRTVDGNKTSEIKVTVSEHVPVDYVGMNSTSRRMNINNSSFLVATVFPLNATNRNVTWSSSDPSIVTVAGTGLITAKSSGTAVITARAAEGNKAASCTITVNDPIPVEGVSIAPASKTVKVGTPQEIKAIISPSNASNMNVIWSSSNSSVAVVDEKGWVTAKSAGTTTVTARTADGGKTASCVITVPVPVSGVTLNHTSNTVIPGGTLQLTATVAPSNAADKNVIWSSSHPNIATVSASGLVTAKAVGTATIIAKTADGNKTATSSITVSVPVSGVSLSITSRTLTVGNSQQIWETVAPSNATNKNVTWSSSNENVAIVGVNGRVTAKGLGTATITVKTVDGSKTATCQIIVSYPVTGISVSPTSKTLTVGGTQQLSAAISPNNATNKNVTWSTSNANVATVTSSGLVTAKAVGTTTITAKTADGNKTAASTITVSVPVTGVTLNHTRKSMTPSSTLQLTATVAPSNASNKNVSWYSYNTNVATVSATGLVTAKEAGTATIRVSTADGSKTAMCAVTVSVSVTGVSVTPTSKTLTAGSTQQLQATIAPSNATNKNVAWSSSNESIATVGWNGLVTAKGPGTATITVKTTDGSKTATSQFTVTQPVNSVSVSPASKAMTVGGTQQLTATVSPSNATNKNVTWSSSNTSVAIVSSSGMVTAKSPGTAIITVKTTDGSKTATSQFTVAQPVSSVSVSPASKALTVGSTQQLTATVSPSNATNKNVIWSSSNITVATVSASGVVTAKGPGTASITAKTTDGSKTAACQFTITQPVNSVKVTPTSVSTAVGGTRQLTATVEPSNVTNRNVTWNSSNTSIATVSSSGMVTARGPGTAVITAKTVDGSKISTSHFTITQPVSSVSVSPTSKTLNVGGTQQLAATISPSNATNKNVIWSSSNTNVATVSSSGLVIARGQGTTIITVKTADRNKTVNCYFTVT